MKEHDPSVHADVGSYEYQFFCGHQESSRWHGERDHDETEHYDPLPLLPHEQAPKPDYVDDVCTRCKRMYLIQRQSLKGAHNATLLEINNILGNAGERLIQVQEHRHGSWHDLLDSKVEQIQEDEGLLSLTRSRSPVLPGIQESGGLEPFPEYDDSEFVPEELEDYDQGRSRQTCHI